jgi:hypothetical protein
LPVVFRLPIVSMMTRFMISRSMISRFILRFVLAVIWRPVVVGFRRFAIHRIWVAVVTLGAGTADQGCGKAHRQKRFHRDLQGQGTLGSFC